MAGDLVTEVDYMSHLVDALLQLARIDGGVEPWRRERFALGELVARTCRLAEPLAAERGLRLTVGAAGGRDEERGPGDDHPAGGDGTPPVWGDPDRLRQLLLILLDNALRYTPAGGSVAVAWWGEPGAVVFEVADTGPGIAPEHLPRLFDRFYRVDKARSRELGGSGLGLAIAEAIARAHGGELSVRSAPDAGTTFRLTLPARP
jgi:signal transduction histidine kinase